MNGKWYNENYVNRRNWILANLNKLNLTSNEAIVVLMIDYFNEFNLSINPESLAQSCNLDSKTIDETLESLSQKGNLAIVSKNRKIYFNIDGLFEEKRSMVVDGDIFEIFESEFGRPLTRRELETLNEVNRKYDKAEIINALREALIYGVRKMDYVEKILINGSKDEQ